MDYIAADLQGNIGGQGEVVPVANFSSIRSGHGLKGRNVVALSLLGAPGEAGPTDIQSPVPSGRDGGIVLDLASVFIVEILDVVVHGE